MIRKQFLVLALTLCTFNCLNFHTFRDIISCCDFTDACRIVFVHVSILAFTRVLLRPWCWAFGEKTITLQLLTGFEYNICFVWPQNGPVALSYCLEKQIRSWVKLNSCCPRTQSIIILLYTFTFRFLLDAHGLWLWTLIGAVRLHKFIIVSTSLGKHIQDLD